MAKKSAPAKKFNTQQSLDAHVWSACNILRRSNCAGALQYVPELSWLLFLRILDIREQQEAEEADALGIPFRYSVASPYRWQDWAAPYDAEALENDPAASGWKRYELTEKTGSSRGDYFQFVNNQLIPHLKSLKNLPDAAPRQKVISEILSGVERTRVDTERNFQDVLDKIHDINPESVDDAHIFALSQVYEGLLLKMGEKGNDGGQFFTPREVIRLVVETVAPRWGEAIYDPCCGTGGFLAQAYEYLWTRKPDGMAPQQIDQLKHRTFFGREKENLIYPIALANLVLHGIDDPRLWHGNTLSGEETYGGLYTDAPGQFDVILTNPPFGGKENKDVQSSFDFKTGATQVLFLQHVMHSLKNGGRCGIVLDEGVLFRTNETAFLQTKRKLLDECNLYCIVSLPGGVFTSAGAGVKTNLLFFEKGKPTSKIWYYDLSDLKIGKKKPLTRKAFEEFVRLLPTRGDSENSWSVDIAERRKKAKAEAERLRAEAIPWENKVAECDAAIAKLLASDKKANNEAVAEWEEKKQDYQREAKNLRKKAEAVEANVYDLKAVNPNRKAEVDERTPEELIRIILEKGKEVEMLLAGLKVKD